MSYILSNNFKKNIEKLFLPRVDIMTGQGMQTDSGYKNIVIKEAYRFKLNEAGYTTNFECHPWPV